jgi:hypothetical protein
MTIESIVKDNKTRPKAYILWYRRNVFKLIGDSSYRELKRDVHREFHVSRPDFVSETADNFLDTTESATQHEVTVTAFIPHQVLYSAHILPKRLPFLPGWDFPSSAPIPLCIAVFTGLIDAES